MNKLNYTSAAALLAAFHDGAKFEMRGKDCTTPGPVLSMTAGKRAGQVRAKTATSGVGNTFYQDGRYAGMTSTLEVHLVQVAEAPKPEPFLKRFVLGKPAYCPATREVVESVEFTGGAIVVTLTNEDGISRTSTNYDHEGKHHWVQGRSLVLGELPALPKPVPKTYTVEELFKDAPEGVYSVTQYGGAYHAVVSNRYGDRAVTFVEGAIVEPLKRSAWSQGVFTLTDKKLTLA